MRRHVFNIVSVLSLLLCMGMVAMQVRSYRKLDSLFVLRDHWGVSLDSSDGTTTFVLIRAADWRLSRESGGNLGLAHELQVVDYRPDLPAPGAGRLGFGRRTMTISLEQGDLKPIAVVRTFAVPDWFICLLIAALPATCALKGGAGRVHPRQCLACGYDLTGNTSGVCPECGTPITPA